MTSPEPDSIPQPLIKYIQNFKQTFNQDAENSENSSESLTKTLTSQKRDLHNSKFRSIFWRFYLSCFSNKRSNWVNECDIYRSIYKDLKAKFLPIKDEYLVNNVKQDVRRTMPDKKIFREEKIQEMMTDILLLWSIASPCGKRLSYRQGVHEILAPMIFVLKQDHATYSCMKELYAKSSASNSDDSNLTWPSDIDILLDPKHIEADSFLMLCRLMFFVEPWYGTNQLFKQLQNQTADHNYQQESENELENSTVPNSIAALLDGRMSRSEEEFSKEHIDVKLERIHNSTLRILDFELYQHLKVNDIIPQVYGIRWLRLLFGREFNHEDSLAVWDFIFSFFPQSGPSSNNSNSKDSNSTSSQISTESSKNQTNNNNYNNHYYTISNITDMVFCSMLTKIRHKLLSGGEQVCVQYLMKYPKITDISLILDQTTKYLEIYPNLYLREKETFGQKALMDSLSNLSIAKGKTLNSMLGSGNKNVSQIISRPTILNKTNMKQGLDTFSRDVTSSISDWTKKSDWTKSTKNFLNNLQDSLTPSNSNFDVNRSMSTISSHSVQQRNNLQNNINLICADELNFGIGKLQDIIYNKTDQSKSKENDDDGGDNDSDLKLHQEVAELCLVLANLKHIRDVLKGTLPASSLGQFQD